MTIKKALFTNPTNGYFNAGVALESEVTQTFPSFVKGSSYDDANGIDGQIIYKDKSVKVQLKCAMHPNGLSNPKAGYSVAHKTTQRKLAGVDYLVIALPEVIAYSPIYTLNHNLGVLYVVDCRQAIKRKFFAYNKAGEMYFPKKSRLILDRMICDGYADPVDIVSIV